MLTSDERRGYVWDRSFDLRYQILDEAESGWRPAVAIGLQDFMGTGFYSSEYIVATKTITPRLRVSAGLGWGRLAGVSEPPDTGRRRQAQCRSMVPGRGGALRQRHLAGDRQAGTLGRIFRRRLQLRDRQCR
ncbi:hypothetical protein DPM13_03090 [Paracoccus mutanolyticus]|uniref:Uncharacterized protein n=1 Tax=Paracoccus mutanolyticus TaxID=1499308 RepID=A0ABN5M9S4_9RHOB|nr:hypothetical protein DPM13_03090 [Paracoccus mutanolyticus]